MATPDALNDAPERGGEVARTASWPRAYWAPSAWRLPHAFRSLADRNLRLFFAGQCVSLVGTWMQNVAQAWLVYRLTHSPQLLGAVVFAGQIPSLLFGIHAGALADRVQRRRIVLLAQIVALAQAVALAIVTLGGWVRPWHVLSLAAVLGVARSFEMPARQALLGEIAGRNMPNAVALNSSVVNAARAVGPAAAGFVVAITGEGVCFALNAISFLGTLYALLVMDLPREPAAAARGRSHAVEGLAYVVRTPHLRALLGLLGISALFGMPYQALLPVFAADVLGGTSRLFGSLQGFAGAGALFGAASLLTRRGQDGLQGLERKVGLGATLFGSGLLILCLSRVPALSAGALLVAGYGFTTQMAATMTLLQGLAPPGMRGRLMGLHGMLFMGMTPIGALVAGFAAHRVGAPGALLAGAAAVLAASGAFRWTRHGERSCTRALSTNTAGPIVGSGGTTRAGDAGPGGEVMAEEHRRIHEYLEATRLAVLSTIDHEGAPASRVMGAFAADGFDVYFSTREETDKVRHIRENPNVAFYFQQENQDHARFVNVVIQGKAARVVDEDERRLAIQLISVHNTRFRERAERGQLGDTVLFRVRPRRVKVLDRSRGSGSESLRVIEP